MDMALGEVEADGLVHEDFDVELVAHDGADRRGDVGRGEHGQRDLVEQGLECEVVAAVDDGYVDGEVGEVFGGMSAGKAAADDEHARSMSLRDDWDWNCCWRRGFGHSRSLVSMLRDAGRER